VLGKVAEILMEWCSVAQSRRERLSGVVTNATAPLAKERQQNGSAVNMPSVHSYYSPEVHTSPHPIGPIFPWIAVIIAGLLVHSEGKIDVYVCFDRIFDLTKCFCDVPTFKDWGPD
jgi:hypothetical protein